MVTRTWKNDKRRLENSGGGLRMPRHNLREIVLMVVAVLGGLGILLLIGTRLILVAGRSTTAGTGGGIGAGVGGVSASLFAMMIVAVLAFVGVVAVFLWRR
jgi:hypothetical protein